jgi:hypothetical protein
MPEAPGDVEVDPHQLPMTALAHEPVPVVAADRVVGLRILGIEHVVGASAEQAGDGGSDGERNAVASC